MLTDCDVVAHPGTREAHVPGHTRDSPERSSADGAARSRSSRSDGTYEPEVFTNATMPAAARRRPVVPVRPLAFPRWHEVLP